MITQDGVPRGIMVPTSDATLLDDVQEIVFARARKAVRGDPRACRGDRRGDPDVRRNRSGNRSVEVSPPARPAWMTRPSESSTPTSEVSGLHSLRSAFPSASS